MRYRVVGPSDLRASVVGFGCWALGGRGWGPVDDRESMRAVNTALESGINLFDTADIYGFGHAETVLGKALSGAPEALVATKVGLRWDKRGRVFHDLGSTYIRSACENSLRRLGREYIDLYFLHWPDPASNIVEALGVMSSLVDEGKVRYFGASNLKQEELQAAVGLPGFIAYQDRLNLLEWEHLSSKLPFCHEAKIAFLAYEPLLKGLLSGKYQDRPVFGRKDHRRSLDGFQAKFSDYNQATQTLATIAAAEGIATAALALALLLDQATLVIPGVKTAQQALINSQAALISEDVIARVRSEWPSAPKFQ